MKTLATLLYLKNLLIFKVKSLFYCFAIFSISIFSNTTPLNAQSKKVIITDHYHYLDDSTHFVLDVSPHFLDDDWKKLIANQSIKKISSYLGTNNINYYKNENFNYQDSIPSKNLKTINRSLSDFFVSITSSIRISGHQSYKRWGPNYVNYVFVLWLRIENTAGKKVYKKTVRIPFQFRKPNYLYAYFMSKKDFDLMYRDALNAAFVKKSKIKKRNVQYAHNNEYERYKLQSDQYNLLGKPYGKILYGELFVNGLYVLNSHENINTGQIEITGSGLKSEFTEIFNIDISNRLLQTSKLRNTFTGQNLSILSGISTSLDLKFEKQGLVIPRVIVNEEKKELGKFEYLFPGILKGELSGKAYQVKVNNNLKLFEVYKEDKLLSVIQFGPYIAKNKGMYKDITYFKKGMEKEEIGRLLNIYFFARISNYIKNQSVKYEAKRNE